MADTDAFPEIKQVSQRWAHRWLPIDGPDILTGQVVAFATTGVSMTVIPAVAGTTAEPIGVAIIPPQPGRP